MMQRFTRFNLPILSIAMVILVLSACTSSKPSAPAPVVTPRQASTPVMSPTKPAPTITVMPAPVPAKVEPQLIEKPVEPVVAPVTITEPPAAVSVPESVIKQQQAAIRKVVVLLPDRPSLTEVNREIEKGIRLAHEQQPHNPLLQLVFIHDDLPADALLLKAKAHAPDWIIGPLTKQDIQGMAASLSQQQVVLNRLESATTAVQLGLPVEDEVTQLLDALPQGQQPIAVVVSQEPSEQRLFSALQQQASVRQIPVLPIVVDKYKPDVQSWLLNEGHWEQSRQRIDRMSKLLRQPIEAVPQARSDVQALILLSQGKQAHQYMPSVQYTQLRWPVLATSRLLPTKKGERFNEPDFEQVRVLVAPYLVQEAGPQTAFEALGWDSYQLLGNPTAQKANTMTGELVLNGNNQLVRKLRWQVIKQSQLTAVP